MQFKDVKQGYPVYILNTETVKAANGKVINVSQPYFPTQQAFNPTNTNRMIDITIEYEGRNQTFSIPENSQIANAPNLVISSEREAIIREVEVMKAKSEEVVNSVEKNKKIIESCEDILTNWNPAFAEKKEQDKRLTAMENKIGSMESMMRELYKSLKGDK